MPVAHRRCRSPWLRGLSVLALLGCSLLATASQVYQWKDANGVTHYSDRPPVGQKVQDRRIDPRGEPMAQGAAAVPADSPQCATAKLNLSLLDSGNPVRGADADGNPGKVLDATERANQRNLAQAAVTAYCTTAASAASTPGT